MPAALTYHPSSSSPHRQLLTKHGCAQGDEGKALQGAMNTLGTHASLTHQVEGVLCTKGGSTSSGTLHLTAHHAIFHFDEEGREEMWVSPI